MELLTFIISLVILIMSVVLHELSHGYVAELLGDPTPRLQGRLTINPIRHLELFGSVIVPIITSMAGFTFGWAKPVQWNPYNIKNRRVGEFLISIAGPLANFLIALVFGLVVRFGLGSDSFIAISHYIVLINITLAIFNLIPIPPLDGSKIFFSLLPPKYNYVVLWPFVEKIIPSVLRLFTGVSV